jgi:hypothetical protein
MIYGEGNLGEPDENTRCKVIENHYKWVDALNSSVVTPSVKMLASRKAMTNK